jgi:hypothetical protein
MMRAPKKNAKNKGKVVVIQNSSNKGKQRNQSNQQISVRSAGGLRSEAMDARLYRQVLSNPWEPIPVRLGGETMQPSGIATCTTRFTITTSSVGNQSFVYYPWADSPFIESNSADAPYSYNATSFGKFPQGPSMSFIATGGRIIAAGIRVTSLQNSTADQGLITIGCLPRETVDVVGTDGLTQGGFPYFTTTTATQGFNEFMNYLGTETYPFRCGASAVWRPEDPLDFTFRSQVTSSASVPDVGSLTPLIPFFVVGISGTATGASVLVELISHIEYTITEGTTGVVNTGMGSMSSIDSFKTAKSLFAGLVNTSFEGITGGLANVGGRLLDAGIASAGEYFSSSVRALN